MRLSCQRRWYEISQSVCPSSLLCPFYCTCAQILDKPVKICLGQTLQLSHAFLNKTGAYPRGALYNVLLNVQGTVLAHKQQTILQKFLGQTLQLISVQRMRRRRQCFKSVATCGQCYITFQGHNLQMFQLSQCLPLVALTSLVLCLRVRPRAYPGGGSSKLGRLQHCSERLY